MSGCGLATNTQAPSLLPHLRLKKLLDTENYYLSHFHVRFFLRRSVNGAARLEYPWMNRLSYSSGQVLRRT